VGAGRSRAAVTIIGKDSAMEESSDYVQIGRFIYGTARLEGELAGLLGAMGREGAEDSAVTANARKADAMFARLPAIGEDKSAFTALMQALASFGEQRDEIFTRIAELPQQELAERNDDLAAWTQEIRRFRPIVEALVRKG
jgi:hypothetical protein